MERSRRDLGRSNNSPNIPFCIALTFGSILMFYKLEN